MFKGQILPGSSLGAFALSTPGKLAAMMHTAQ